MTELEQYVSLYFGIGNDYVGKIADLFKPTSLAKNNYFTEVGKHCHKLSFIKSGYIRVFEYRDGKEITQWISSQGEFVTDLSSIIFKTPARWNIQAIEDCELYTISDTDYRNIHQIIPEWQILEKLFISKCFLSLEDRVFSFISLSAEERYQQLFNTKPDLFNHVPLQYLASMMGMSPETLSRIRKKMIS